MDRPEGHRLCSVHGQGSPTQAPLTSTAAEASRGIHPSRAQILPTLVSTGNSGMARQSSTMQATLLRPRPAAGLLRGLQDQLEQMQSHARTAQTQPGFHCHQCRHAADAQSREAGKAIASHYKMTWKQG